MVLTVGGEGLEGAPTVPSEQSQTLGTVREGNARVPSVSVKGKHLLYLGVRQHSDANEANRQNKRTMEKSSFLYINLMSFFSSIKRCQIVNVIEIKTIQQVSYDLKVDSYKTTHAAVALTVSMEMLRGARSSAVLRGEIYTGTHHVTSDWPNRQIYVTLRLQFIYIEVHGFLTQMK